MEIITFIWFVPTATDGSGCACMSRNLLCMIFSVVFGCLNARCMGFFSKSHCRRTKATCPPAPIVPSPSCNCSTEAGYRIPAGFSTFCVPASAASASSAAPSGTPLNPNDPQAQGFRRKLPSANGSPTGSGSSSSRRKSLLHSLATLWHVLYRGRDLRLPLDERWSNCMLKAKEHSHGTQRPFNLPLVQEGTSHYF